MDKFRLVFESFAGPVPVCSIIEYFFTPDRDRVASFVGDNGQIYIGLLSDMTIVPCAN